MRVINLWIAVIAFLGNALAAGGWLASSKLSEEEEVILSSPTDGSKPSESQRKLMTGSSLPLDLPIGSTNALRDHVVSDRANHGLLNVFVRLGFQPEGTSDWFETGVQGATYGYTNWPHARTNIRIGAEQAVDLARKGQKRPDEYGVWAVLRIWYWCEGGQSQPGTGLSIVKLISPSIEEINIDEMMECFEPWTPDQVLGEHSTHVEMAVVGVPGLDYLKISTMVGKESQTLEWRSGHGVELANWPGDRTRNTAVNWLYLDKSIASGFFPSRFTLGIGEERTTYTQYGSLITPPVMRISATGSTVTVEVRSTPGSDLEVFSSTNNVSWSLFQKVTNVTEIVRGVLTNAPPMALFKATSR